MSYSPHLQRVRTFPDQQVANAFYGRNHAPLLTGLPDGPIVDLGSGLGEFLCFCRDVLGRPALGIDLDAENVALARQAGLEVTQEGAAEFLTRPGAYAAITMNDVIEHIPRPEIIPLVALMRERLLPGGKVLLKTPNMSNPLTAARNFHMDFTHTTGFTEETMVYVLEQAGFSDNRVEPVDIYVTGSALANAGGRLLSRLQYAQWRFWYKVQGVPRMRVLTKGLIGVGVRPA